MRVAVHDFGHNYRVPSLQQPASLPGQRRLIIVSGEEGAGKSTLVRALLPSTPNGARLDAEDIGQTNPCPMDDEFFGLLRPERGRPR
jgi:type II secretory pathway predicted ATPase ExeA